MIGTGIDVRVKIQDIVASQLPEYVKSESPLTDDFLKQFYISQEYQGGSVDFATNLDQYLKLDAFTEEVIFNDFTLTEDVAIDDTVIHVNSTKSFPDSYGLLKIDDEIVTYTGLTTNTFTGVIRGFSGVVSFTDPQNPGEAYFEQTSAEPHSAGADVSNLSTLFLRDFYEKIKLTFTPGFENIELSNRVAPGTWVRQARAFYQSKGSEESIIILFKILFGETPRVLDLEQYLIKASGADFNRRDFTVATVISGNPVDLKGRTIFQSNSTDISGAISEIEPFTRDENLYYKLYLFVADDEISQEKKLFTVPGRTFVQREWKTGDTTLTVDTTIGFRDNGEFISADGTKFFYEDRSINQFLGVTCEDEDKILAVGEEIVDDIYVFGFDSDGGRIELRLTGTLSDLDFGEDGVPFSTVGENIVVDSLGENILPAQATRIDQNYDEIVANSFIYNTSVRFRVENINGSVFQIRAPYLDDSYIRVNDKVDILVSGSQNVLLEDRLVTAVGYEAATITVDDTAGLPLNTDVDIRRRQKYAISANTPLKYGNDNILSNVQNLYDGTVYDGNFYVATNSLPSYEIETAIIESTIENIAATNLEGFNSFLGTYSTIIFPKNVDFITGDLVTYSVQGDAEPICDVGEYYVQVLDNPKKIILYVSQSFIGGPNFVELNLTTAPGDHIFTLESQRDREIIPQKIFRKIPVSGGRQNITIDRPPAPIEGGEIAVLTNGVVAKSYISADSIYLGPLESIDAVSGGEGYSPITPPQIKISEPEIQIKTPIADSENATTARATPIIKGKLEKILIDPQDFDIDKIFSITVTGGNSSGASAIPQIERRKRSVNFDSRTTEFGGGIAPVEDSIQFITEHNFTRGERVVYNNRGEESIGISASGADFSSGERLANGGIYYAKPLNNLTIQLYNSFEDLDQGINPVGLTSNLTGFGVQSFDTLSKNTLTGATITEDGGFFFYRNMEFAPENVLVEYDEIRYKDHGFQTGEIIEYGTTDTAVGGMSTENSYYVVAPTKDIIKLCDAGVGATITDNYDREDFVNFTDVGVGTHVIHYPEIKAEIVVSFASTNTGEVVATPFIRGEIDGVYVNEGGFYGSDILNFEKNPPIDIIVGERAKVNPIISLGEVVGIQILNTGKNYQSTPDIEVVGDGSGALLRAVVEDGEVVDVIIIKPGANYTQENTQIKLVDPGKNALLIPRIRRLRYNEQARFGFESLNDNEYSVISYGRKIREDVYGDFGFAHSPIIGWANDGNPIYGGFALSDPEDVNSDFRAMKTAYDLKPENIAGRPSLADFGAGIFIDDFVFTGEGDLDKYNGRYCRTPEFPNGVYAYFAGISTDVTSSERAPQFPYFIGPEFRDAPLSNDDTGVSQSDFNLNDKPIFRNTQPYAVGSLDIGSEFLVQSYLFETQETSIEAIDTDRIQTISVVGAGQSYAVGDIPVFDSSKDIVSSVVSEVTGKDVVSVASSILEYNRDDVKIVKLGKDTVRVYIDPKHEYLDKDTVVFSGLSTAISGLSVPQIISVNNKTMTLYSPVEPPQFGLTDDVTDIFVNSLTDNFDVGSEVTIGVGGTTQNVEVLNIFPVNKALRVRRGAFDLVIPTSSSVVPVTDRFEVRIGLDDFNSSQDYHYYFNPRQTVGGGPGVGLQTGATIARTYTIGSINYNISVPVQAIYAPNHGFIEGEAADLIIGDLNDSSFTVFDPSDLGSSIVIPDPGSPVPGVQEIYIARLSKDLIGIRLTADSEPVFFGSDGSDSFVYSIRSKRFAESSTVSRIQSIVETGEPHKLETTDKISLSLESNVTSGVGTNESIYLQFDDISQSLIVDPRYADPAGIDTANNIITLDAHNYVLGDYLLYENYGTPISGLETHQKYFVVPFDVNRFQLAETAADIKSGQTRIIDIASSGIGSHKFAKVNPSLKIVKNNSILFDLSDSTLLGRELNFYYDQTLTEIFDTNGIDDEFVVSGVSTEGFVDATKTIKFSENNPPIIYYGVSQGGYISTTDTNATGYNSIEYVDSTYASRSRITKVSDTVFKYSLPVQAESDFYNQDTATIKYTTSSKTALGGIGKVRVISSGNNFSQVPEFITVDSTFGTNATLRAESTTIGKVSSIRIKNPGWGYSADNTLRPKGIIQPKVSFNDSDFVTGIDIIDAGSGYQNPPNVVLLDAVTREVNQTGSIKLEVQSSSISDVDIEVAPTGLSKNLHELYTINNSNGIPILNVGDIDNTTGIVSFIIQTPINDYSEPPFRVNDEVFVENVLPQDGVDKTFLNSEELGFQFLKVVGVLPTNPIVLTVQYPEEFKTQVGGAQTFQNAFSSLVNRNIYPVFKVNQSTAIFIEGERLSFVDVQRNVFDTDLVVTESNTNFFKVKGNFDILVGDTYKGQLSGVEVTISAVERDLCRYEVNSVSRINTGWQDEIGFLNTELQVIPDNDYYQNLSYSIKSTKTFEEVIGPVNTIVHPAGLKNFADTKLESSSSLGIGATSDTEITVDLIGLTDVSDTPLRVDRINNFDLGYDDEINNNRSNAIRFNSRTSNKRLTDYVEVRTNRVLLMDDISNQFIDADNIGDQQPFTEFDIITSEYTRAVLQVRDPFTGEMELIEIIMLAYDNDAYTLEKGSVSSIEGGYGEFIGVARNSTEYTLRFSNYDIETQDLDFKLLSNKFTFDSADGLTLGYNRLSGENISLDPGETKNIFADGNSDAVVLYVQVIDSKGAPYYYEYYTFNLGNDAYSAVYSFDATETTSYSAQEIISFNTLSNSNFVAVEVTNLTGERILVTSKTTSYRRSTNGEPIYRFKRDSLPDGVERSVNLINTRETGSSSDASINVATFDSTLFGAFRSMIYVEGTNFGALHQVMVVCTGDEAYITAYPFLTQGEDLDPSAGIGSFGTELSGTDLSIKFYPDAGLPVAPVTIRSYHEAFYTQYDSVNYRNIPLVYAESEENYYLRQYTAPLGLRKNKIDFLLSYQGVPIYEKSFNPSEVIDNTIANGTIFNISDHFFSRGEELYYEAGSSSPEVPFAPLEINQVTDYLGVQTTTMPDKVWCVKRDLNRFQLAPTEADSLDPAGVRIVVTGNGAGNDHKFGMTKKLEKTIITIDGVIQAPIVTTNKIYTLDNDVSDTDEFFVLTGIGTISTEDLFRIDDEYVRLKNVGLGTSPNGPIDNTGSFPLIEVERGVVGSIATSHTQGDSMELYRGSFNIVGSAAYFTEAPSGRGDQQLNENNLVEINSSFQGRTFLQQQYDRITLFDDISDQFDGDTNSFLLTTNSTAGVTTEVENGSGVVIINDIYQTPTTDNNEGNNYFYTFNSNTGINSITFTGITSTNGERVASEFDVNQNQIPRGGLIVSVGSTPGLGYAPLYGASLEAEVTNGSITNIITVNTIGVTTTIQYATYNEVFGELVVTAYGPDRTPTYNVSNATYFKESGFLLVESLANFGGAIQKGSIVVLEDLEFTCVNSGITTNIFPDGDSAFIVDDIFNDNSFTVKVGISTIDHTYVSGGTFVSKEKYEFNSDDTEPNFVYLDNLEFACPNGETAGLTTTIFPIPGEEGFSYMNRVDDAHYKIFVGISTIVHEYVGGGVIGQYNKNNPGSGYNSVVSVGVTDSNHTGNPAIIRGIPGNGGELSFVIDDGGSGYSDPYVWVTDPSYSNLPITGVSRRTVGPTSETGLNLFITCDVGAAGTISAGRSEYFEISNYELTNQGYSFLPGDVFEVVGLVTDKSRADQGLGPIEPFQITVTETFTDNYASWNFGETDYIDSIKRLQDGVRTRFPLIYNGESISFELNETDEDSSVVDLSSILLIYVNTVLQVPEVNYTFNGGTTFQFTRAPFAEDDIDIYFYRGKRNVDSRTVTDVNESIRPGDELQMRRNNAIEGTKTQDIRTVTDVVSSDTVRTNTYFGRGDLEETDPREVAWDKQKRDIFIYGEVYTKVRDSIEPIIRPKGSIIADVDASDSVIYLDSADYFYYEQNVPGSDEVLTNIKARMYRSIPDKQEQVNLVATVDPFGRLNSNLFPAPGQAGAGYVPGQQLEVSIALPDDPNGVRALTSKFPNVSAIDGSIVALGVTERGSGYDENNPPLVFVEPFTMQYEDVKEILSVEGFAGIITGIQPTAPVGGFSQAIRFSYKVDPDVVAATLQPGDYVAINNTVVGNGVQASGVDNSPLNYAGIGTQFLDCVYRVASNTPLSFRGYFDVNVSPTTNLSGITAFGEDLGQFSWGRISVERDIDLATPITNVKGQVFTSDMKNYPSMVRTSGGLRNQGGVSKAVS